MIFLVYKTDAHHSYDSRDIIGIATNFAIAVGLVGEQAEKEHEKISNDQMWNLLNLKQTQGYIGMGEFQIEEVKTDTLL